MGGLKGPGGSGGRLARSKGGQGVCQQGPKGSRGTPTGSQGVKGEAYRVPWGYRVGMMSLLMINKAYLPEYK